MRCLFPLSLVLLALGLVRADECPPYAPDEVDLALRELEDQLPRLRREEPALARRVAAELERIEGRVGAIAPFPARPGPAVHVYCCHDAEEAGGRVRVRVTDRAGPVVLVLSAQDSLSWTVELAEGVDLRRVIVVGGEPQRVENAAALRRAQIPLLRRAERDEPRSLSLRDDSVSPERTRALVRELAGEGPQFFVEVDHSEPAVEMGPGSERWRRGAAAPALTELNNLALRRRRARVRAESARARFHALYRGRVCEFAGLSLLREGPKLARCAHVTSTPQGLLALGGQALLRLRAGKGGALQAKRVRAPRYLSWPGGLVYDAPRQRVLIPWFGGRGGVSSYSPRTQRWELLWQPARRDGYHDLGSIALSEDGATAWSLLGHALRSSALVRLDVETLTPTGRVELSRRIPLVWSRRGQLVTLGARLGCLLDGWCWVIEPATGEVVGRFRIGAGPEESAPPPPPTDPGQGTRPRRR